MQEKPDLTPLKARLYTIIFEAETRGGKRFDVLLMLMIVASVITVFLESIPSLRSQHSALFLRWSGSSPLRSRRNTCCESTARFVR